MNIGVVFDAGSAAYASVRIEFFRSLLENKDCCPALIEGKSFEVMNLGGLAHLSFQRTEAAPSFAVFEGWAAEARRRTLPGLLPSTARGVAHSLKLPRVRRKHNTENCSMPT